MHADRISYSANVLLQLLELHLHYINAKIYCQRKNRAYHSDVFLTISRLKKAPRLSCFDANTFALEYI